MKINYVQIILTTLSIFTSTFTFSQSVTSRRSDTKLQIIEQKAVADTVISDNLIVIGKGCIGSGCVESEEIGEATTLKLKKGDSPTLRLEQDGSRFPPQIWDIGGNELEFYIRNVTGSGTLPFRIGSNSVNNAFVIDGANVYIKGAVLPQASLPSDRRLKSDISPFANAGDLLKRLTPKTFEYDLTAFPNYGFPKGTQYGLIAQEVEKVLPDYVTEVGFPDGKQFKTVNYMGLIPILVQSNKEQQVEIERQRVEIEQLKRGMSKFETLESRFIALEARLEKKEVNTSIKTDEK
jgi:hypothetical protein